MFSTVHLSCFVPILHHHPLLIDPIHQHSFLSSILHHKITKTRLSSKVCAWTGFLGNLLRACVSLSPSVDLLIHRHRLVVAKKRNFLLFAPLSTFPSNPHLPSFLLLLLLLHSHNSTSVSLEYIQKDFVGKVYLPSLTDLAHTYTIATIRRPVRSLSAQTSIHPRTVAIVAPIQSQSTGARNNLNTRLQTTAIVYISQYIYTPLFSDHLFIFHIRSRSTT